MGTVFMALPLQHGDIATAGQDGTVRIWKSSGAQWARLQPRHHTAPIFSIGADAEGARRVGVPVGRVKWSVYVLCGAFAGLA